jgi:hypothetical protein
LQSEHHRVEPPRHRTPCEKAITIGAINAVADRARNAASSGRRQPITTPITIASKRATATITSSATA